jgi:hypothetical protein
VLYIVLTILIWTIQDIPTFGLHGYK